MLSFAIALALQSQTLRPPAVPLVTHDPYFSIWSEADHGYDTVTRHWTHAPNQLDLTVSVNGRRADLIGKSAGVAADQTSLRVTPTRTIYTYSFEGVGIELTFTEPILPNNLDLLARPATYVSWHLSATDGKSHQVAVMLNEGTGIVTDSRSVNVQPAALAAGLSGWRMSATNQRVLGTPGDGTRIEWGSAFLALPTSLANGTVEAGGVGMGAEARQNLKGQGTADGHFILAYDEIYEVRYFGHNLVPYWKRSGDTAEKMLAKAERDYPKAVRECEAFDAKLMADLTKVGGSEYAQICALAYRQAFAACGIAADAKGQPLMFTKENTSNGDIATVDVIFPMDPMLIALSPALAKATLVPDLDYAASDHWKFPNAPHDLGTYPIANGTDDGGEGMPVEESGNMIILCDAICQTEGSAAWVSKWWPKLAQWEQYLEKYGNDPEDQLCTDDFMGHLAHNSNLAIKAIIGIAAYGDMARMRGDITTAERVQRLAREYATHWMEAANDGDHTRLAFDKPNTWSQKYNLVWDRILGLNVFPVSLAQSEIDFYKRKLNVYGLPLDSRTKLSKADWSIWSASLATNESDFEAIIAPLYRYLNTTTNRQPMVDSYITDELGSDGMHARSVVGGMFVRLLDDRSTWMKWAKAGDIKVGPWAPFPKRPTVVEFIPSSKTTPQSWRMSLAKPAAGWERVGFDDSSWTVAQGPFGSDGTPGIKPTTQWTSDDIWLRREVTVPAGKVKNLQLEVYHDEDIEVYINGVLAGSAPGYQNSYEPLDLASEARALIKPGAKLVIAVHCHQTTGGQGVDVGVVDVR